jgi:hypothetical protein
MKTIMQTPFVRSTRNACVISLFGYLSLAVSSISMAEEATSSNAPIPVVSNTKTNAPLHLFLFSGQSNMVLIDPEATFMPAVRHALPGAECIAVKWAVSGQEIGNWVKRVKQADGSTLAEAGPFFKKLMALTSETLQGRTPDTVSFIWMQGERDARVGKGDTYASSLKELLLLLQKDLGREDIDFVLGRLSDYGVDKPAEMPDWNRIRDIQVAFAESYARGAWVNTDDLNEKGDGLHYSKEGRLTLGERFAEKAVALIKKNAKKE